MPAIDKLDFEPFCRLLETIALTAWHAGSPRSIRVGEVETRLTGEERAHIELFEKEVKAGVLRLLFAFFLRPGVVDRGDQTYEFTHKTFAEYLVARRLTREIDNLAADFKQSAGGRGWKDEVHLQEWVELFGPAALDEDMQSFLAQAMASEALRKKERVGNWKQVSADRQAVLAQLLNAAVRDGMPMHAMMARLKPAATFQEMNRQALHAEVALLQALNACLRLDQDSESHPRTRSRTGRLDGRPLAAGNDVQFLSFHHLSGCELVQAPASASSSLNHGV